MQDGLDIHLITSATGGVILVCRSEQWRELVDASRRPQMS